MIWASGHYRGAVRGAAGHQRRANAPGVPGGGVLMRVRPAAVLKYAFLVLSVVPVLFPFSWMVLTSLNPFWEVFSPDLLPSRPTLDNYVALFSRTMFPRWFFNS